ncbi:c-type cytochrome biogenesis protein CcsB [Candidatus Sumerlaeota bacterium]|nr:c-type cytochrome biogenesis protein CcsB [Candidatus Sumerlaeota bacterium]
MRRNRILLLVGMATMLLVLVAGTPAQNFLSSKPGDRLATVPHNSDLERAVKSSSIDEVAVQCEGWNETVASFARLKLHELTGRTSVGSQNPSFTILSMIYQNEAWFTAKIFPLEHPDLLKILNANDKWVSAKDVLTSPKLDDLMKQLRAYNEKDGELTRTTKLLNAVEQTRRLGREDRIVTSFAADNITPQEILKLMDSPDDYRATQEKRKALKKETAELKGFAKAGNTLLARVNTLSQLPSQFLIVPDTESVDDAWVRPLTIGAVGAMPLLASGKKFEVALQEAFATGKAQSIGSASDDFLREVSRSRFYPTKQFRVAENLYVKNNPWMYAAWTYLLSAITFGLFVFFRNRKFYFSAMGLMAVGFVFHTAGIALRLYFRGAAPVSNMFESITFCSWAVMLIAFFAEGFSRRALAGLGSTIIAFLLLTAAGLMPLHDTRLHPLRAVLDSYWLNIHVTMMLLSYASFAIAAFFCLLYLIKNFRGREALFGGEPLMTMMQTEEFSYRLVQLGWPILTFGITLGGFWADHAWGRFWGWDPKETWAFITWCTYTVYLHTRMVMGWRGTRSVIACLVGFVMVLITWLGVSYLPWFAGGLHTYASPN